MSSTKNSLLKALLLSLALTSATYAGEQKNPANTNQGNPKTVTPAPSVMPQVHIPPTDNQQATESHLEEPTWWNADRGTWALVFVGIAGTCAAVRTLRAIRKQNVTMLKQVREMRKTGKQTDLLIAEAIKQSIAAQDAAKATKESADAALLNAQALIHAERAWVLVNLDWNPLYQNAQVLTSIEDGEQVSKTVASLRVSYRNHGSTPAWIIEMRIRMHVYDSIPEPPEFHLAPVFWQGSEPLGMGQESTKDVTVEHMGRNFTGWRERDTIIYGRVIYGDAFGKARTTSFGYELRHEKRLERLAGFPEYSEST